MGLMKTLHTKRAEGRLSKDEKKVVAALTEEQKGKVITEYRDLFTQIDPIAKDTLMRSKGKKPIRKKDMSKALQLATARKCAQDFLDDLETMPTGEEKAKPKRVVLRKKKGEDRASLKTVIRHGKPLTMAMRFIEIAHAFEGGRDTKEFIHTVYGKLFGEPAPMGVSLERVRMRVGYELQHRGYLAAGHVPARIQQNWEATSKFDVSKLTPDMRDLLNIIERNQVSENGEAKVSGRKKTGKNLGLGVGETWAYVFGFNAKAKKADRMSDEMIAGFMADEFPQSKAATFARVQQYRSNYNRGMYTNGAAPKVKSVPYDDEGNEREVRRGRKPGAKTAPKKRVVKKKAMSAADRKKAMTAAARKAKKTPAKKAASKKKTPAAKKETAPKKKVVVKKKAAAKKAPRSKKPMPKK